MLVGGVMFPLHATTAGIPVSRVTTDMDMVLRIETEATTAPKMQDARCTPGLGLYARVLLGALSATNLLAL